ncbi:type II toxin-antitoxin system ParD family antitoxin [Bosea sp. R86505]|uniref:type II toxin-antitoxin system ParD family antitoxin n=1 Tax=Bosea sp. R86505 TaxID=3101710 RepID=UPI003671162C
MTDEPGTDHMQYIWLVACLRGRSAETECGHFYGSNGSDFFQQKCPRCQGGQPGPSIEALRLDKDRLATIMNVAFSAALVEGEASGPAEDFDIESFLAERRTAAIKPA